MTSTKRNSVYVFILLWLVPSNQFSYMIRRKALLIEKKREEKQAGSIQSISSLTAAALIQTIKSRYIFSQDTFTCCSFKDWLNPHALHLIT